jgi:hypothetical protein
MMSERFLPLGSGFFPISTKHNAAGSLEPWLSKKDGEIRLGPNNFA